MEDFIENFSQFKDWLYQEKDYCEKHNYEDEGKIFSMVIDKFKELNLDNAF